MKKSGKIGSFYLDDDVIISVSYKTDWEGETFQHLEIETSTIKFSYPIVTGYLMDQLAQFLVDCKKRLAEQIRKDTIASGYRTEEDIVKIEETYAKAGTFVPSPPVKFFPLK